MADTITVYTDGACDPNPGIGGWAAILIAPGNPDVVKEISGAQADTTNNRMELTAAIQALQHLKKPCVVTLYTDSEYVKNAFTQKWIVGWQKNGWKTSARKPVKNEDLWKTLIAEAAKHQIHWQWVRGHANDPRNNRCDELAVQARLKFAQGL